MNITAKILYDYIQCPHKVWRDIYGPKEELIKETNPFVQMLWDKGAQFEKEIILTIGKYLDLSSGKYDKRFEQTLTAMKNSVSIIYQGVLKDDDLMGIPDLLIRQDDGQYLPVDIKSGCGFKNVSNDREGTYKKAYAVQLCLYADVLIRLGFLDKKKGLIIDIHRNKVEYALNSARGSRTTQTWWDFYIELSANVKKLVAGIDINNPARGGVCKMCQWYASCEKWCIEKDDLTNIFYLGRAKRDILVSDLGLSTVDDICRVNIENALARKKENKQFLKGVGEKTLVKWTNRAKILKKTKRPVVYEELNFPNASYELFFDIEADPTRDFVYLHGVWERTSLGERFIHFVTDGVNLDAEKKTWDEFWKYINNLPQDDFVVYYYSPYEKSIYKRMASLYPDVKTVEQVEQFFDSPNVIDLYTDMIFKKTDWPLTSYSIKDIVTYLGFKWRDETPSGALSIQWFNEYIETGDESMLKRIVEYNEDDCKATMILKDKLVELSKNYKGQLPIKA